MIYVDTNVLIAYINPKDEFHEKSESLILKYRKMKLTTSQITVLELYSVFSGTMSLSDVEIEALVNYTIKKCKTHVYDVEWDKLYEQSLNYANKLKLKTLDLLHVIAAYLVGAKTMISFDKDINRKSNTIKELLGLKIVGLENTTT